MEQLIHKELNIFVKTFMKYLDQLAGPDLMEICYFKK
jgi:hypothetical protein